MPTSVRAAQVKCTVPRQLQVSQQGGAIASSKSTIFGLMWPRTLIGSAPTVAITKEPQPHRYDSHHARLRALCVAYRRHTG
jgi:hypothetical protein